MKRVGEEVEMRSNPRIELSRIIVAIVCIPILIFLIIRLPFLFALFVSAVIGVGIGEFYRLADWNGLKGLRALGICGGMILPLIAYSLSIDAFYGLGSIFPLLVLARHLLDRRREGGPQDASIALMGFLYVGWMLSHLILVGKANSGKGFLLFLFFVTWMGDFGSYLVGKLGGRRHYMPWINPRKSWEGMAGGIIMAILSVLVVALAVDSGFPFLPGLGLSHYILLGVCLGLVGQLGDICESILKRDAGVKDTGSLIPGHGGVLDRFDSLIFTTPVLYYYMRLFL